MMDLQHMMERFGQLADMAVSNPDSMGVFKGNTRKMFTYLMERDPRKAEEMLGEFEMIQYHNYLSRDEARTIMDGFMNYDGTKGGKWSSEKIDNFLKMRGLPTEQQPYYNFYALAVAMNRIHSDYGGEIKDLTDDYDVACYNLALCDLKNQDRPRWIRNYFSEKLED